VTNASMPIPETSAATHWK